MITFQDIVQRLAFFWQKQGCILWQGYDLEVGAGTFNPATFLRCIGPEPFSAAYIEPSRRPTDGRYGENPNRLQHFFQYQVILKPSPPDIQDLYLASLEAMGFDLNDHDIRFVQDDWESPTIGAWGLGWEVWMDGMEITQFTYFQALAGMNLDPIPGEITYGIERLAMYLQKVDSIYELQWNDRFKYGDIYHQNEVEWSHYNFEKADTTMWLRHFEDAERESRRLMDAGLPIPAYDFVMKASHAFNILDARGVISVTERTGYIRRIRDLAKEIAAAYYKSRQEKNFPLLHRLPPPMPLENPIEGPPIPSQLYEFSSEEKEDFLLEIGSEELPDTYVPKGMESLEQLFRSFLAEHKISCDALHVYGTPRRLALLVKGLAKGKPEEKRERRGPAVHQAYDESGMARPAAIGFFRSLGMETPSLRAIRSGETAQVHIATHKGEEVLVAQETIPGTATAELLQKTIPDIIQKISFPKKMRWGSSSLTYARPLQWLVALYGADVLPLRLEYLFSDRMTAAHRQRKQTRFPLSHASEYVEVLRAQDVLVDPKERREQIHHQLRLLEEKHHGKAASVDEVVASVTYLTEYPTLVTGHFSEAFLRVPKEVLISEMVEHQRYFPLTHPDGSLQPTFVIVADTTPTAEIVHGNERVLSARLADGAFLYDQDLHYPLASMNEKLAHVTFHQELGSLWEKVQRLILHTRQLQQTLGISTKERAERAALLSKADLTTGMVYEFPDLQGVMGRYYALANGEDPEVAQALAEQWMPRGESDSLPQTSTGTLLSLADKIDNLLSCFRIGQKPTSSTDPYALRRQALGLIRILLQGRYRLPLRKILSTSYEYFAHAAKGEKDEILADVESFLLQRAKTVFLEEGIEKDELEASLSQGLSDVCDAFSRAQALHVFRQKSREFPLLFEVYKRARGQLAQGKPSSQFDPSLCCEPAEKNLSTKLSALEPTFLSHLTQHDYTSAYRLLATLQPPLAQLFDEVKILADDPRLQGNRLALLERVFSLFGELIDFAKIQEKS